MADLKPCPFCGGEAEVVKIHSGVAMFPYTVVCKSDDCSASVGVFKETRENAIKAWNTRKPMEAVVAKLENLKVIADECCIVECDICEYKESCLTGEKSYKVALDRAIEIVLGKE